jgi:uncharacterized protein YicC (UPF0701 family)
MRGDGFKITVELGAVNRRQPEISVNLPRELEMFGSPARIRAGSWQRRFRHGPLAGMER